MIMLSFVIPTLNENKTIVATLDCLRRYTGPAEIIVSDGNSTDGTIDTCRRYTDKVVVYDRPQRQTIGMARNMGAAGAVGDYLVFLDADVTIPDPDEFFAVARTQFRDRPDLVALTVRYRVDPATRTFLDSYMFTALGLQFWFQNNILGIGGSGGEFQMIRAAAFRAVGGFDETLAAAEDMDLFRRLSKIGKTRFVNSLTVYHTGRRAHAIGWRKLGWQWFSNTASVLLFRKSASKEWKEIR
jgi:glycosyltransferase involved in cell wall biosynthesis